MPSSEWSALVKHAQRLEKRLQELQEDMEEIKQGLVAAKGKPPANPPTEPKKEEPPKSKKGFWGSLLDDNEGDD